MKTSAYLEELKSLTVADLQSQLVDAKKELFNLRFSNCTFKKRFVSAGLNGREIVKVAYSPDCLDTVYLYENGDYIPFMLSQKMIKSHRLVTGKFGPNYVIR